MGFLEDDLPVFFSDFAVDAIYSGTARATTYPIDLLNAQVK